MKIRLAFRLLIAFVALPATTGLLLPTAAVAAPLPCASEAQRFWTSFRTAALKDDFKQIAKLAKFPLSIRSELDDEPAELIQQNQLIKRFSGFMNQDSGLKAEIYPVRKVIESTARPSSVTCNKSSGRFSVASLNFSVVLGKWYLTKIYKTE